MTYKRKEYKKEWVYVKLIHSAVPLKRAQHCKSTTLQYKLKALSDNYNGLQDTEE